MTSPPNTHTHTHTQARFVVVPAVREVQRQCIAYWIVAVSVVGGIIALLIIVVLLGMVSSWSFYIHVHAWSHTVLSHDLTHDHMPVT